MAQAAAPKFNKALARGAAALTVKAGVLSLLTARARVKFNKGLGEPEHFPQDAGAPKALNSLLEYVFLTALPSASVEVLKGVVRNAGENEPYFLALAVGASLAGLVPANGVALLAIFVAARLVHAVTFLAQTPQPSRTFVYLVGLGAAFVFAASVLLKAASGESE